MRLLPRKTGGEGRAPIYSFAAAIAAAVCPTAGIFRRGRQSAGYCAGAEKLGNGPRHGFWLFQQHEVSGTRQIDHPHPLAQLLAQRMPIPGGAAASSSPWITRRGAVPALHQSSSGTFRLVARCATKTAGQHSTCASIFGSDAGESQRAPSTVTQSLPFILTCCRIAKMRADRPRRGRDEATRCKQRHGANQRRPIDCQTAGDPVAEGMSDQVRRTTADRLNDASDVTGQIVQGRAIEGAAAAADATDIDRDRLEPSGNQRARQMIKISGATARIREQHDWCARTAKCAFQCRVTDVDVSMLLQSHLRALLATGRAFP